MKLNIKREDLLEAILPLRKVLAQTTRDGFKDNILILNLDSDVYFHAFSDELCLTTRINFNAPVDKFRIGLNLLKLSKFASSCPEDSTISMNIGKSRVTVACNKSKMLLPMFDGQAYPNLPSPKKDNEVLEDTILSCDALLEGIKTAELGLPEKDGIYTNYDSIIFDPSDEEGFIRLMATKGTFLVMHKIPGVLAHKFKLRSNSIEAVKDVLNRNSGEDCELMNGDAYSYIKINRALISIRNLDTPYPDYLRLFTKDKKTEASVNTKDMLSMMTRAKLVEDSVGSLKVDVKVKTNRLEISANTQQGEFTEDVDFVGEPIAAGLETLFTVNVNLLDTTAKATKAELMHMAFSNPNAPIVIKSSNKNTVCLLMPVRQR